MDISNKKLKKALTHYKNGEYESALKICEKFLEKEYSNEEALELEGDILYKLGRIDDAIVTWKINSEYNNNEEAAKRLASVDKDRKEFALSYTSIQNMSSEDRLLLEKAYRENIELKKQVENSDLLKTSSTEKIEKPQEENEKIQQEENINEEQNISIEKGKDKEILEESFNNTKDFESHTTPVDEFIENFSKDTTTNDTLSNNPKEYHVLETNLDDIIENSSESKNEPEAIDLEEFKARLQHLKKDDEIKKATEDFIPSNVDAILNNQNSSKKYAIENNSTPNKSKKKIIIAGSAVIAIIVIASLAYNKLNSNKKPIDNSINVESSDNTKPVEVTKPSEENNSAKPVEPSDNTSTQLTDEQAKNFVNDMEYLISVDSIDGVNNILLKTPKSVIPESALSEYEKAENFMKTTGLNYYYTNGMDAYNNNDYLTAIDYFKKAKPYAKDDFRGPTMLFLTAASYEKLDDINQAVNAYKDYIATYPDTTNYGPESLYFLANYYSKNNNPTEAKKYAQDLTTKYPNSMYNNDNIKAILK